MFQDKDEELTRLQEALMEAEPDEEEWEEDEPEYDDCVYNADRCDEDLEEYAEQVLDETEQGTSGLAIAALLLALGVLGVLLWFLLKYWI